jgi:phage-related minor tail protein
MNLDAMKQALAALEIVTRHFTRTPSTLKDSEARSTAHAAITALRLAIEQAERNEQDLQDRIDRIYFMYQQACQQRDELMDEQSAQIAAMRGRM